MAANLTLRAPDLPQLEHVLRQLEVRGKDMSPLMARIGQAMETSTLERFDQERAPDGSRWAPSIRARTEGGKTLTKSARLRQSMTHNLLGRDAVEIGTNVIYAGAHQEGATITARSGGKLKFRLPGGLGFRSVEQVIIPKREFLGVSADDEDEIIGQAEDYLGEVLQ